MMKAEKRLFQSEPACKLADRIAHRVTAPDRPAHHPQAADGAVGLGVDVTHEFEAGEEGECIVAALSLWGRRVDLPSVVKIPEGCRDRAGVDQRIKGGE